ncbi:hypothetical protein BC939DRAFT_475855 [Gamsiella multidivaricata]|uniref:uncharacterized protein n=1 Tax=Gamsiella multidivaricata TaxID=101098 RepID=UPI002221022B|nr:uncharacterized protein BC939DRAFT_475855 [Gamsiella multidivaricata]KAI7826158.1 hypothetical protein BC939DRAFT_475855 [Gamsiella multidivaricata]
MSDTPAVAVMPTSISSRFNPLTIPEIIAMIGQLIPLTHRATYTDPFNPTRTTTTFIFAPRDLLACTAVSRAWRRVLLPILWRSYDSALMRYVPLAALQINSVHFQSFRDQFGHHHPGPFYSTNLRRLIISQQHSWTVPFMLSNPGLQHLTWTGLGHPFLDREYSALMKLANLRDLCLSNWNLIGRQLALVLCASPQLSRLSLSSIDGVQDLEGMSTLYALEEISLGFVPLNSLCLLDLDFKHLQSSPGVPVVECRRRDRDGCCTRTIRDSLGMPWTRGLVARPDLVGCRVEARSTEFDGGHV